MKIRLGYVAISLDLHEGSPNKTMTYKRFLELPDDDTRLHKLQSLTKENLDITRRVLIYNKAHDIALYRFTSKLIPLVTHNDVFDWDYIQPFQDVYTTIGNYIKERGLLVSAHPDHFTILNTPKKDVFESSLRDLEYHVRIFEAMDLSPASAKLVLHVGGTYGSRKKAMERFIKQFKEIDPRYQSRIILENDDKSFTAKEVLEICQELSIPMVLDIHHHFCNHNGEEIGDMIEEIFDTWRDQDRPPKIHVSSPKSEKQVRAHADYVDINFLMAFINKAKSLNRDFDIMIEAKQKDKALHQLMKDFKAIEGVNILDAGSLEVL
ncbi:UV DNA damage repair endonuclease UvsE [Alkaliphilus hydrothermalis]|uniref:UV DNA damage endonuclease n=1 Tax=Alkaliphilus hydrothermalis TaxID=1482730 RepID=A0ABS2NLI6_9FIRM|nr:UV DNA damage repair endonuclease UvsE [Alkaliphilus hydrothermalis]MBM7613798.1 UV DNA damage endonuclease [Alkaliphilus hydrothermalis]